MPNPQGGGSPSISGGRLLHLQPEDVPYRGDKGPT
jgi:hypothetical protein